MDTVWACTVMPLYLYTFNLSRNWLEEFFGIVLVISSNLSAKVDFPWSICAIIQKFLILYGGKYYVLLLLFKFWVEKGNLM